MSKQFIICAGVFVVGAYAQKKFDVCGKLEKLWDSAMESIKTKELPVEDGE